MQGTGDRCASGFIAGVKAAVPVAMGYIPISMAYGVIARSSGFTARETVSMSLLVYAGSAQFVGVSLISSGAGAGTVILTTFLVNLRHLLMSTALAKSLKGARPAVLAPLSFWITDETFAVASSLGAERIGPSYLAGLFITSYLSWALGSFMGSGAGMFISSIEGMGLDFALPAMFIGLLVIQLQDGRKLGTALVAFLTSVAVQVMLPGYAHVMVATIVAATLGAVIEK